MGYISRLTGYALKHKAIFIGYLVAAGIGTIFNILTPLVLADIVDNVIFGGQYQLLIPSVHLYLLLIILYAVFDILGRYGAAVTSQNVIYNIRKDLYDSLMQKDLAFYDENETGQLLARVTTDVTTMREFLFWGYRVIFIGTATLIGVYVVMFSINFQLALYMLSLLPLITIFIFVFARKVRPLFYAARDQYGEMSSVLAENITGMKVVRSYAATERESDRVRVENAAFRDRRTEAFRLYSFYGPMLPSIFGMMTGVLLFLGGVSFSLGTVTYGEFVGFLTLVGMLLLPARFLSWGVGMYQRASASAERTFYILDHKDRILNPKNPKTIDIDGKVEFVHVDFSYEGSNYILHDVSLTVEPGQVVALLGGTGSGKTSLVNLVPRFYDVDSDRTISHKQKTYRVVDGSVKIEGESYKVQDGVVVVDGEKIEVKEPGAVFIDGVDVRELSITDLRQSVGMVHQDPFLFSATLRENISFGNPEATMDMVERAAKTAMIHDYIMTLDEGYESIVGERGVTLSGGQKQRVSIARALLADPEILILDDSTSSVDAKTEMMIQMAMERLMRGRTTFVITHRLSTVRNADLICMMERGRIVEIGTHEELIEQGGLYANIYQTLSEMDVVSIVSDDTPLPKTSGEGKS